MIELLYLLHSLCLVGFKVALTATATSFSQDQLLDHILVRVLPELLGLVSLVLLHLWFHRLMLIYSLTSLFEHRLLWWHAVHLIIEVLLFKGVLIIDILHLYVLRYRSELFLVILLPLYIILLEFAIHLRINVARRRNSNFLLSNKVLLRN